METQPITDLTVYITNFEDQELLNPLVAELKAMDINVALVQSEEATSLKSINLKELIENGSTTISLLLEEVISTLDFDFNELTFLTEGESKVVRLLNEKIVVMLFKPTVYSYTKNRYGTVEGTDVLRAKFTAELYRQMNIEQAANPDKHLGNAFLALIDSEYGPLLLQRRVEPGNLEVRVKRYHVGSPIHRYRYTDKYPTVTGDRSPLKKWDRFEKLIVCFDWRNPLTDEEGTRLADEPLSDDYASIWIEDIASAKKLASDTFLWLEKLFSDAGLVLIDICYFIDESGKVIFGEVSPDCMRVREGNQHPKDTTSFDKDIWRDNGKELFLAEQYNRLYQLIFKSKN